MEETKKETVFSIPEHRMDEFSGKIAALNKKAAKVGAAKIQITVTGHFDRSYTEHPLTGHLLAFPLVIRFVTVTIDGLEPKFAGWSFLARIDHETEGNIINSIPGVELNDRYRTLGGICEHCKIKRYRKSSFVVRHENGEEKQVGSACIKDFLGHGSPEKVATYCESIFSFLRSVSDDDFRFGGSIASRYDLAGVLALTSATIRACGWLSATKAREIGGSPTAYTISTALVGTDKYADELRREIGIPTEDDKNTAAKAIEWIKAKEGRLDDYFYNLKAVCSNGTIELKRIGLVASLIPTYRREMESIIAKAVKEPSAWIGHPDLGRMTLKGVQVIGYNTIDGFRGPVHIYRFLANGKDKLTWFASSDQGIDRDAIVDITFSVKKLEEYKEEHQTVITRAKITVVSAPTK